MYTNMKAGFMADAVNWIRVRYVGSSEGEPLLYKGENKVIDAGDINDHGNVFRNEWGFHGTAVKFKPVADKPGNPLFCDSWQSITFMEEYMNRKSFEELRLEDYESSREVKPRRLPCPGPGCLNGTVPVTGSDGFAPCRTTGTCFTFGGKDTRHSKKTTNCFGASSDGTETSNPTIAEVKMEQDGDSCSEARILKSTSTASRQCHLRHTFPTETPLTPLAGVHVALGESVPDHAEKPERKETLNALGERKDVLKRERKEVMDALFRTQLKCLQIQQSLHHLLLIKVERLHTDMKTLLSNISGSSIAKNESPVTSQETTTQWSSIQQKAESTNDDDKKAAVETPVSNDVAFTSAEELQKPLEALLKCSEIQVALHQRLFSFSVESPAKSEVTSKDPFSAELPNYRGILDEDTDEFLVYAKTQFDSINFSQNLPCSYYRDPFQASRVVAKSSDKLQEVQSFNAFSTTGPQIRQPHGQGVLVTQSGQILYDGQWRDGKRCGKGKALIVHGKEMKLDRRKSGYYDGQWKENMRHGQGRMVYLSSASYEGEWQFDAAEGSGCLLNTHGCTLEGEWTNGVLDGCGIFTWPDGTVEHHDYAMGEVRRLSSQLGSDRVELLRKKRNIESRLKYTAQTIYEMREQLQQFEKLADDTRRDLAEQLGRSERLMKNISEEHVRKLAEAEKSFSSAFKEEKRSLEKQLEEANRARLCQICFENNRDCIIMPCTHMLYCRECVATVKLQMNNRCPTCRGPISGEINCNLDLEN